MNYRHLKVAFNLNSNIYRRIRHGISVILQYQYFRYFYKNPSAQSVILLISRYPYKFFSLPLFNTNILETWKHSCNFSTMYNKCNSSTILKFMPSSQQILVLDQQMHPASPLSTLFQPLPRHCHNRNRDKTPRWTFRHQDLLEWPPFQYLTRLVTYWINNDSITGKCARILSWIEVGRRSSPREEEEEEEERVVWQQLVLCAGVHASNSTRSESEGEMCRNGVPLTGLIA